MVHLGSWVFGFHYIRGRDVQRLAFFFSPISVSQCVTCRAQVVHIDRMQLFMSIQPLTSQRVVTPLVPALLTSRQSLDIKKGLVNLIPQCIPNRANTVPQSRNLQRTVRCIKRGN